ncbi:MAG: hypothetical protein ACRD0J_15865 [Acidimicrobiales bacterium]
MLTTITSVAAAVVAIVFAGLARPHTHTPIPIPALVPKAPRPLPR